MRKLICNFNVHGEDQYIYEVDTDTNKQNCIALTTLANLPLSFAGLAHNLNIQYIELEGDPEYGQILKNDILTECENLNLSLEIEVL